IDGVRVGSPERCRALALEVLQQLGIELPRTSRQLRPGHAGQHWPRAQGNWFARRIEALDDEEQVPINKAGRNALPHALGTQRHVGAYRIHLSPQRRREADTVAEHRLVTAGEKEMVAERQWVALDAALAGREVGHRPGWAHVAVLAVLAALARWTVAPLAVGAVDVNAEDHAFVAGGAVAAVLVEGGVGVLAAVNVIERAEEQLFAGRRAAQIELVVTVGVAEPAAAIAAHLVAVVTVDAA